MKAKWTRARWVRSVQRRKHAWPLDEQVIDLCVELNNIPGVKTFSSCSGHSKCHLSIWLTAATPRAAVILGYYCSLFTLEDGTRNQKGPGQPYFDWNLVMRVRSEWRQRIVFELQGLKGRDGYRAARTLAWMLKGARENDYQDAVQDESW